MIETAKPMSSSNFWLETCSDDLTSRMNLTESMSVDVAILGGGFTGLWTAYYLLQKDPSLKIAILEKEIIGFGASGRNGGWCSSKLSVSTARAIERFGLDMARNLQIAMNESVNEVEHVINDKNLDVDWQKGGSLRVALGNYGLPFLHHEMELQTKLGLDSNYELLDETKTRERVRIQGAQGSLLSKVSGVIHPGKLVRQLARQLECEGVVIFEKTEVIEYEYGGYAHPSRLVTRRGTVTANLAIVLAGEAYLSRLPKLRRQLVPIYSFIALTEPLTDRQWSSIGWDNRETIGSTRLSVDYLQRTSDNRILFGGRGKSYHYGSRIRDHFDYDKDTHEQLMRRTIQWFPHLSGIRFTHVWGGPLGVCRDWTPNIVFNKQTRVAGAWGYAGQGVSTTNLAGRILADLIMQVRTPLTELPLVQYVSPKWEIEPFRWTGISFVSTGLGRVDKKAEASDKAPRGNTLAERLGRH